MKTRENLMNIEKTKKNNRAATYHIGALDPDEMLNFLATEAFFLTQNKAHTQFLEQIFHYCKDKKTNTLNTQELALFTNKSENTISVYSSKLVSDGYLEKRKMRKTTETVGRAPVIFQILDFRLTTPTVDEFKELPSLNPVEISKKTNQQELFEIEDYPDVNFEKTYFAPGISSHKVEIFSTFTLISALRLGNGGQRLTGSFSTPIFLGKEQMRVMVKAVDGEKIAGIMDTKALIVLSDLARKTYNSSQIDAAKPLVMDTSDLCHLLGKKDNGGNRQVVWSSVNAWRQTNFKIMSASQGIQNKFGDDLMQLTDFSFIAKLQTLIDGKNQVPIKFAVWFEPTFLNRLLDKDYRFISSVHGQIMHEKIPGRLLFYYWCRRVIQYKTVDFNGWEFRKLKTEMAYHMTDSQFRNLLKKFIIPGQVNNIYCYKITCDKSFEDTDYAESRFHIWADAEDSMVKSYFENRKTLNSE